MKLTFNGQELRLRRLTNVEYERAQRLATKTPLYRCPTCKTAPQIIKGSGGATYDQPGTYQFRGEKRTCDCESQKTLRLHYLAANIGDQYQRLDWNDFTGSKMASFAVDKYLGNWESYLDQGYGIEFGGPLGIGKTFAATHIGKELIKLGQRVYFLPFVDLVTNFEKENSREIDEILRTSTYVILDEILPAYSERMRAMYSTHLEAIIRHRTNFNLPTIITTNMAEDDLDDDYPRTYSLLAAKQIRVDMSGEDVRRSLVATENLELAENKEIRPIT